MKHRNLMKSIVLFCSLFFSLSLMARSYDAKVYAVSLDHGAVQPLQEVAQDNVGHKIGWKNLIYLQPEVSFQTIEGVGGAFNEIGGQALAAASSQDQAMVMNQLFSDHGAGFSFCRTAIGASDFGIDAYSYAMVPDDYKMKHFSIDRDKTYVLPYLKSAFAINPDLTLFASPWSPPAWMKVCGTMEGLKAPNNELKQDAKTLKAYARYFVNYVQAYAQEGVPVDRICIQNENDADTKYPSCTFPAKDMVAFANNFLIPAFQKNGLTTGIYAGTLRAAEKMDLMDFMMTDGKESLDGVGVQYTDTRIISDARAMMPQLKMFHTEGHCYNGENSVEQAQGRLEEIASYLNAGCTAYTYWNMILNETTESGWGWTQNSLINIDRKSGHITYNPDYNAMYIISKFVRPGDVRIAGVQRGKGPLISLRSPDGSLKVIFQNTHENEQTFEFVIGAEKVHITAPGHSLAAVVINAAH